MLDFSGTMYLAKERIPQCGEDAGTFHFNKDGNGYLVVCDGSGGAGSELHETVNNRKSAYLASRWTCKILEEIWEKSNFPQNRNQKLEQYFDYLRDTANKSSLEEALYSGLCELNRQFPMNRGYSTTVDVLPTTFSGITFQNKSDGLYATYQWAGDSRGYLFELVNGLAQITDDDTTSLDAYTNLEDDSIMTNRLHGNLKKPIFKIHKTELHFTEKKPMIFFCASDGCYDYFDSPMKFEIFLLNCFENADNFQEAAQNMEKILNDVAGDDFTCLFSFYELNSYEEVKEMLSFRYKKLQQDMERFDKTYWENEYKNNYYRMNKEWKIKHGTK